MNEFMVAGGGDLPEQRMMQQQAMIPEVRVEVVQPPQDNTLLWASGVIVPLIIAMVGWWIHSHRKKD